jgi:hypothetical protein
MSLNRREFCKKMFGVALSLSIPSTLPSVIKNQSVTYTISSSQFPFPDAMRWVEIGNLGNITIPYKDATDMINNIILGKGKVYMLVNENNEKEI